MTAISKPKPTDAALQSLLETVRETQTVFWNALYELELALQNDQDRDDLEIDANHDYEMIDLAGLRAGKAGNEF